MMLTHYTFSKDTITRLFRLVLSKVTTTPNCTPEDVIPLVPPEKENWKSLCRRLIEAMSAPEHGFLTLTGGKLAIGPHGMNAGRANAFIETVYTASRKRSCGRAQVKSRTTAEVKPVASKPEAAKPVPPTPAPELNVLACLDDPVVKFLLSASPGATRESLLRTRLGAVSPDLLRLCQALGA